MRVQEVASVSQASTERSTFIKNPSIAARSAAP